MLYLSFILLICLVSAEVPSYIPVCGRRNPNLNECIKNSVEKLRPKLREGIPELDVPPIDPLILNERLVVADTPDFKSGATNIKLYDAGSFEIRSLTVDFENKKVDINLFFRRMRSTGDYDVKAKIIVPVEATGPVENDASNIESNSTVMYKLVKTKKGQQVFFTSAITKLKIGDYKTKFVGNSETTTALSDAINSVVNGNKAEIIAAITPHIERAMSRKQLEIANQICKYFTFEELFPDRE
ncbi:uncharacterized protein LOC141537529 [Cotesia typhae]|uniref:uncharacterized protein LOC141537529 n=1 Tax=Cotesia typhae TaxID=2053667 RepID=UPI003D68F721